MKVTVSKLHGTLDLVFLNKGRVVGSETLTGKTDSPYTRSVVVSETPDEVVLDIDIIQEGFTEKQILEGFQRWQDYADSGLPTEDVTGMPSEKIASKNTSSLIAFIKGEFQ